MTRFRTVKQNFTSLPNEVIQGFYLTPNALAILITCLSYPNDWEYRPISIWKNLKLSRDKTYAAFDELVEKGHCIRIRTLRGNLRAEVDYIFFDEIKSCQQFLKDNEKELSASNLQVEHKWNFKKCFRHPEPQEPEDREPEGQEVSKIIESKKIYKKRSIKESNPPIPKVPDKPIPSTDSIVPPSASAAQGSTPLHREDNFLSSPELFEILEIESKTKPFFRPEIVARWITKFGAKKVLETINFFFHVKETQKKPIPKPEAWMESAFKANYAGVNKSSQENKQFAENLKKKYRLSRLKINKRYCQDTQTGRDYYYHLPCNVFQEALNQLIE